MVQESILKHFEVGDLLESNVFVDETELYVVLRKSSDGELYEVLRQKNSTVHVIAGYQINFYHKVETK